jgi:hypothetical protein
VVTVGFSRRITQVIQGRFIQATGYINRINVVLDHLNSSMDEVTPGKDDTTFACPG